MSESPEDGQTRPANIHLEAIGGRAQKMIDQIDSPAVFDFYVSAAVLHYAELPEKEQHKRWMELALNERELLLRRTMTSDLEGLPDEERAEAEEQMRAMMKRYRKELEVYEDKFFSGS